MPLDSARSGRTSAHFSGTDRNVQARSGIEVLLRCSFRSGDHLNSPVLMPRAPAPERLRGIVVPDTDHARERQGLQLFDVSNLDAVEVDEQCRVACGRDASALLPLCGNGCGFPNRRLLEVQPLPSQRMNEIVDRAIGTVLLDFGLSDHVP